MIREYRMKCSGKMMLVIACLLSYGCTGYMRRHLGGVVDPKDYSRTPYYGEGVVVHGGRTVVEVDFGKHELPKFGLFLFVVRQDTIVGKLEIIGESSDPSDRRRACSLMRGSAQAGDRVVGVQYESKYKKASEDL
jgi:hypothetical protein